MTKTEFNLDDLLELPEHEKRARNFIEYVNKELSTEFPELIAHANILSDINRSIEKSGIQEDIPEIRGMLDELDRRSANQKDSGRKEL